MFNCNTQKTIDNRVLGAGALFVNYDLDNDTMESARKKLLSATLGGNTFNATANMRQVNTDCSYGAEKGMEELTSWDVTLQCNLLEWNSDTISKALGAVTQTEVMSGDKNYIDIEPKNKVELSDYIDNITWVSERSDSSVIAVQIFNALSTEGISTNPQKETDNVIPVTFKAHYDVLDKTIKPYKIRTPKGI